MPESGVVHKFKLRGIGGENATPLGSSYRALSVAVKPDGFYTWAMLSYGQTPIDTRIVLYGTGWDLPVVTHRRFIGTLHVGALVWHAFEETV